MSKPTTIIKQTYWLDDSEDVVVDKLNRLNGVIEQRQFPVVIEVKRYQKPRSPEANAYLWGVCYVFLSDASGYEREELHVVMCRKYFGTKLIDAMGETLHVPMRSTTHNENGDKEWLGVAEFAEFVDFVIREAAMWYDVVIPPPTPKEVPRQ